MICRRCEGGADGRRIAHLHPIETLFEPVAVERRRTEQRRIRREENHTHAVVWPRSHEFARKINYRLNPAGRLPANCEVLRQHSWSRIQHEHDVHPLYFVLLIRWTICGRASATVISTSASNGSRMRASPGRFFARLPIASKGAVEENTNEGALPARLCKTAIAAGITSSANTAGHANRKPSSPGSATGTSIRQPSGARQSDRLKIS